MSVFIALALAAGANDLPPAEPIPTFDGAQQKWACRFESFTSHETVTGYFGVYRTRVDDEFTGDHTIVQNDAKGRHLKVCAPDNDLADIMRTSAN